MKLLHRTALLAAAFLIAPNLSTLHAQTWTSWNSASPGVFNGTLLGNSVTYNGSYIGGQLTGPGGTNFWSPNAPYTQGGLTSPDAGGNRGFIQFNGPVTSTFTFSSAMTDLYMAFISVGQPSSPVTYTFDQAFTVLSSNDSPNCAYYGCGTYSVSGNSLTGREFSGTVKFAGSMSQLSMTTAPSEFWHGVTIGASVTTTTTPEPATLTLLGTGLLALFGIARRRNRRA